MLCNSVGIYLFVSGVAILSCCVAVSFLQFCGKLCFSSLRLSSRDVQPHFFRPLTDKLAINVPLFLFRSAAVLTLECLCVLCAQKLVQRVHKECEAEVKLISKTDNMCNILLFHVLYPRICSFCWIVLPDWQTTYELWLTASSVLIFFSLFVCLSGSAE